MDTTFLVSLMIRDTYPKLLVQLTQVSDEIQVLLTLDDGY